MFSVIQKWASFVRFSHTVFALPFALAAMMVAARDNRGWPGGKIFGLILAAMVCARTCAMAFNRIVDRKFDALNPRTASRHLPTGQISLASAIALCVVSAAGLIAVSYFLNPLCFFLSPVALVVICFYSLTKRFTDYTHVFLGIALALAPVGAWLAVKGAVWISTAAAKHFSHLKLLGPGLMPFELDYNRLFWHQLLSFGSSVSTSFTRCRIIEFDKTHGLHSLVVAWGPKNALAAAFLAHMIMCGLLLAFGFLCGFRIAYLIGWFLIVGCLVLEHWIARRRSLNWINLAFFRLNALVSAVFLVVVAAEVIFQGGFKLR